MLADYEIKKRSLRREIEHTDVHKMDYDETLSDQDEPHEYSRIRNRLWLPLEHYR
ncbi:MAG: hypothetical protein ACW97A_13570 [Candidatus Thorarchaeota archaeon]